MARVFVPEPKQLLEHKACLYGEIVPLVPVEAKLGLEPDRIKAVMSKALTTFDDDDYLLLDGSNVHCSVAISIICIERNNINLLIWDQKSNGYLNRLLLLDDIPQAVFTGSEKKIFITNDIHDIPKLDFSTISLTSGNDPNIMEPNKIKENMIKILINSQAEDFLLLSGSKTHNSVASAILSKMHGKINFMVWNAITKQHCLRSCNFTIEDLQRHLVQ